MIVLAGFFGLNSIVKDSLKFAFGLFEYNFFSSSILFGLNPSELPIAIDKNFRWFTIRFFLIDFN